MALQITGVRTFIVDGGFRPWTFVKIETSDDGLVGWGDCTDWGSPGPIAAMVDRLGELIVGQDPMQAERIWWELHAMSVRHTGGFAANAWDPAIWSAGSAFLIELIATFVFVIVILCVTAQKHTTAFAGLVIGLTLAAIHLAVIPVTGTSSSSAGPFPNHDRARC